MWVKVLEPLIETKWVRTGGNRWRVTVEVDLVRFHAPLLQHYVEELPPFQAGDTLSVQAPSANWALRVVRGGTMSSAVFRHIFSLFLLLALASCALPQYREPLVVGAVPSCEGCLPAYPSMDGEPPRYQVRYLER